MSEIFQSGRSVVSASGILGAFALASLALPSVAAADDAAQACSALASAQGFACGISSVEGADLKVFVTGEGVFETTNYAYTPISGEGGIEIGGSVLSSSGGAVLSASHCDLTIGPQTAVTITALSATCGGLSAISDTQTSDVGDEICGDDIDNDGDNLVDEDCGGGVIGPLLGAGAVAGGVAAILLLSP